MDKTSRQAVLEELVREALGPRAATLSKRQLRTLANEFLRAGTETVQARQTEDLREAARLVAHARERLEHARKRAAQISAPGAPAILVPQRWRHHKRVLEAHWEDLFDIPGVVGCGIGHRVREGMEVPERCVVVLVEKKVPKGKLGGRRRAIPRTLRLDDGTEVPTDVVEAGEFRLKVDPGCSIGPSGTPGENGTLGSFAVDLFTRAPMALTAMHLLEGVREFPGTPPSAQEFVFSAPCVGQPGARRLGRLVQGTRTGVDAAKIAIESGQVTRDLPGIGRIAGWRPIDVEADRTISVSMLGAVSGVQHGRIMFPLTFVKGLETLGQCIVAGIRATNGDSGAALVDSSRFVLGLLVGGSDTLNAFSPIGDVLTALSCDIPPE
ncbi:MAG: hypothetical protein ACJ8GN_25120 [Longimicrobiaceae bacterium]